MDFLSLKLKGECWLAYPRGMRFPTVFKKCYPMRGRGIVSNLLYWVNRLGLDRLLLRCEKLEEGLKFPVIDNVAFFWPAASRSTTRFYGYRVIGGRVVSYLKFAKTEDEAKVLRKEFENTEKARQITGRSFEVPKPINFLDKNSDGFAIAEYEALPEDFTNVSLDDAWISKIDEARAQIAKIGLSHGDFMWHNFKASKNKLWILDWEELTEISETRPELTDEISFWTAMKHYNKGESLESVCNEFKQKYFIDSILKNQAFAALNSMASRGIAMGKILLKELEGDCK